MNDTPPSESGKRNPASGDAETGGVGYRHVGPLGSTLLALYLLAFTALLSYTLLCFWSTPSTEATNTSTTIHYLGMEFSDLAYETLLLIIVTLCGAMGSMVHTLRSISWYIGNRELRRSWMLKYIMQPFIGGTLALVFYFVIRAGLLPTQDSIQSANLLGFAGIASLVGMFSDQAVLKLKAIAETVFTQPKPGTDAVPQDDDKNNLKDNMNKNESAPPQ